jgi:hypothetical protein
MPCTGFVMAGQSVPPVKALCGDCGHSSTCYLGLEHKAKPRAPSPSCLFSLRSFWGPGFARFGLGESWFHARERTPSLVPPVACVESTTSIRLNVTARWAQTWGEGSGWWCAKLCSNIDEQNQKRKKDKNVWPACQSVLQTRTRAHDAVPCSL